MNIVHGTPPVATAVSETSSLCGMPSQQHGHRDWGATRLPMAPCPRSVHANCCWKTVGVETQKELPTSACYSSARRGFKKLQLKHAHTGDQAFSQSHALMLSNGLTVLSIHGQVRGNSIKRADCDIAFALSAPIIWAVLVRGS